MDSLDSNTQISRTTTQFADSDTSSWTVIKEKKKTIKGIWSFNSSRTYRDAAYGIDVATGKYECGFFKFNKKKDTLKLYVTGLEGCYQNEATKGKKHLIGKVKGIDFDDIFELNTGSLDLMGIKTSSNVNGESSVQILYQFGFKASSNDEAGPYTVDLNKKYLKGIGKFEKKMDIEGELVSIFGQSVGDFESMFA